MKFYVSTCDTLVQYTQGYAHMFTKYWPYRNMEVNFLGYKEPNFKLPYNFKFISLGKDPGKNNWSTPLVDFFESIDDNYFGWGVENLWFAGEVNKDMIDYLVQELEEDRIDKVILDQHETPTNSRYTLYHDRFKIFKFNRDSYCKCSLITQLVKKDFFVKYLKRNKSPWQYEQEGQVEALKFNEDVLFTSRETSPVLADIVNKGSLRSQGRLGIKNLCEEDLKKLRELKYINF